jgi:hypothetical protein
MPLLLSLLSGSLMLLPVGVTLGVYAGIQTQQIVNAIHGKIPPGAITTLAPNGNPIAPNITTTTMYCQPEADIEVAPYRYICEYLFLLCLFLIFLPGCLYQIGMIALTDVCRVKDGSRVFGEGFLRNSTP